MTTFYTVVVRTPGVARWHYPTMRVAAVWGTVVHHADRAAAHLLAAAGVNAAVAGAHRAQWRQRLRPGIALDITHPDTGACCGQVAAVPVTMHLPEEECRA